MYKINVSMKLPTNKSFGLTFGTVFLMVFLYFYIKHDNFTVNITLLTISAIFYFLGFINSKILHPLNFIWFKLGIFLSKLISPLILGVIYFLVVTPTGIIMRFLKKDLLSLKFNDKKSYWINKNLKSKMKNQF